MWQYHQRTGALLRDGVSCGTGYSGHGAGLNNPQRESEHGAGPIPRGRWRIGAFGDGHRDLGPLVASLTPVDHDAHGRSAFFIHGDNAASNHSASHGCIVLARSLRRLIADSADHDLWVVD